MRSTHNRVNSHHSHDTNAPEDVRQSSGGSRKHVGSYKRVGIVFVTLMICATVTAVFFYNRARAAVMLTVLAGDVSVAVSPPAMDEDDDSLDLVYTFTRTDTAGSLTVDFSVSGSADSGTDYTQSGADTFDSPAGAGTVTFADGSSTATVNITPIPDTDYEADETVILTVTSGTGYNVGAPSSATGTITNDDAPPSILEVTKTADTNNTCLLGDCSLREAINAANLDPDANLIVFNIPPGDAGHVYYADNSGPGVSAANVTATVEDDDSTIGDLDPDWDHSWWSIQPASPLPPITYPVFIDGYSQRPCFFDPTSPCSETNTDENADNAILLIELNGVNAGIGGTDGLVITAGTTGNTVDGSTVFGLIINNFSGNGIKVTTGGGTFNFLNSIIGSFIGTDVSATLAAGNGVGVLVDNAGPNMIGCTTADERNVISGNTGEGVVIVGAQADGNLVQGNLIGTDRTGTLDLGNGGSGVEIYTGGSGNIIGAFPSIPPIDANRFDGAAAPLTPSAIGPGGNVIAFNGGDGVEISSAPDLNNLISQNSIFDNVGLGINLVDATDPPNGVTANDNCDGDDGPNHLQNFPVVTSAITNGPTTTINFTLDSTVGETFTIEFFTNTALDSSGNGEGQTFIDSTTVTISGPGCSENFSHSVGALAPGLFVTATATDSSFNTSEFGSVAAPTAADSTVSGRIVDDNGAPVAGVVINLSGTQNRKTITDANGNYRFDEVETTGFYTVRPSRANYSFNPAERSFSQLGNNTEAAFTGSPSAAHADPLNTPEYFVRQHYLDFLGREPDESGFNFWSDQILACGADAGCLEPRRVNVSAAYFLSIEFQQTGGLVDGLYGASYGRRPLYAEFMPDTRTIAQSVIVGRVGWQQLLATNKAAFVDSFVNRAPFHAAFDSMSNETYVDTLITHTRVTFGPGERAALVDGLNGGTLNRARALQRIAENQQFVNAKRNETFVMMQYFGYLRRDPDDDGYQFWLNKLNQFDGNFERAEMVKAFINSGEYRQRFPR